MGNMEILYMAAIVVGAQIPTWIFVSKLAMRIGRIEGKITNLLKGYDKITGDLYGVKTLVLKQGNMGRPSRNSRISR